LESQLRLRVIADEVNECTDIEELQKQLIISARLVMTYQNILNRILKEQIMKNLGDFNALLESEDKLK
jgi:hypothetical protein